MTAATCTCRGMGSPLCPGCLINLAVAEERERCAKIAENAYKAGEGGIDITGGIPAEIYVGIGRGRYEEPDGEYDLARDVADALRETIAATIRAESKEKQPA